MGHHMTLYEKQKAPNNSFMANDRDARNYGDRFNFCCGGVIRAYQPAVGATVKDLKKL